MRYLDQHYDPANVKEFDAAHMINMEFPDEINSWLEDWLDPMISRGLVLEYLSLYCLWSLCNTGRSFVGSSFVF